eukprot:49609_1
MAAKKGTKAVKVHGTCGLQMQKCVCNLSRYNCASCHAVDTKDYLIKLPQYKPNSAKQCNWTGARKSYTRHSKRYHNTKKDHFHGFKPNKQKQSTREQLLDDMTKLLLCEGVRGIKLDERSQIGSVAYNNRVRKSKQNAVPYD